MAPWLRMGARLTLPPEFPWQIRPKKILYPPATTDHSLSLSFAYADSASASSQTIMLIPLQQCQLAVETASINTSGSQSGGIEIPGWDRPQRRESQGQSPYGKAHA